MQVNELINFLEKVNPQLEVIVDQDEKGFYTLEDINEVEVNVEEGVSKPCLLISCYKA